MNSRKLFLILALVMTFCLPAYAQEGDKKEGVSESTLDNLVKTPKKAAKPEAVADETSLETTEKTFEPDPRKLSAKITLKNGKTIKGKVKNFLIALPEPDFLAAFEYSFSQGPTVQLGTDEFLMDWKDVKTITLKKGDEMGDVSCVEDTDASMDRRECTMINTYEITSSNRKHKGKGIIVDKDKFRLIIVSGGKEIKVDTFLGRMKVSNIRDESRKEAQLSQELKKQLEANVKSILIYK